MALLQAAAPASGRDQQQSRLDEKLRRELGDAVLIALADHRTEDICLSPDGKVRVNRQGDGWNQTGELSATQAHAAMGTIATQRGTVVNYNRTILETELPIDGIRFEGLLPPVVPKAAFAIRLRPRRIFTLREYAQSEIEARGPGQLPSPASIPHLLDLRSEPVCRPHNSQPSFMSHWAFSRCEGSPYDSREGTELMPI